MKVLLIFPPQWIPYRPYLSLPSLSAYLREGGIDVTQKDINIEVYDTILSEKYLLKLQALLRRRFETLDSQMELQAGLEQKYYNDLFIAKTSVEMVAGKVENAKKLLRGGTEFYDPLKVVDARNILEKALNIVSLAYHPLKMDLESLNNPTFQGSLEEIEILTLNKDENPFIEIYESLLPWIKEQHFDVVGISITGTSQLIPALTLSRMLKSAEEVSHVVIGGNLVTQLAESIKQNDRIFEIFIDSAIVFEGERPLLTLIEHLRDSVSLIGVPNLIYRNHHEVCSNEIAAPVNINSLPTPDFDGLPLDKYLSPEIILPVLSSRGCYWGKCAFCTQNLIYQDCYNHREAEKVVVDLKTLSQKYSARFFTFVDEAISPKMMARLSEEIIRNQLGVCCSTNIRLEKQFTSSLCLQLFKAGFKLVYPGLESSCDRVLALMDKGITNDTSVDVCRNLSEAGVWDHLYVMVGFPGETREEAQGTIDFLFNNRNIIRSFHVQNFALGKGMKVHSHPGNYGVIFEERKDRPFEISCDFQVSSGLTYREASEMAETCMDKVASGFEGHKILTQIGHHYLLFYLLKYEKLDPTLKSFSAISVPISEQNKYINRHSIPRVKPNVILTKLHFDILSIRKNIADDNNQTEYKSPCTIIFDPSTGNLTTVPHETFEILNLCDGKNNLRQIARILSDKYDAPGGIIEKDCSMFIQYLCDNGYVAS